MNKKQFQTATVNIDFTLKIRIICSFQLISFSVFFKELFFEYILGELFIFLSTFLFLFIRETILAMGILIHNAKMIFIQKEASYYLSKNVLI